MTETKAAPSVSESEMIPIWGHAWIDENGAWQISITGPEYAVCALKETNKCVWRQVAEPEPSEASE